MESGGGAGFLTTVVVLIALILPVLVLFEAWRSRRVALADDAQEATLDPVLSTSGMSRKIVFGMVVLTEAFLLLIAYGANEPFRQAEAKERQKEFAVEAARTRMFSTVCLATGSPARAIWKTLVSSGSHWPRACCRQPIRTNTRQMSG